MPERLLHIGGLLLLVGCGDHGGAPGGAAGRQASSSDVTRIKAALLGTDQTALVNSNFNVSETFTISMITPSNVAETVVLAQALTSDILYGCTNNNYASWSQFQIPGSGVGPDSSATWRWNNSAKSAIWSRMTDNGRGIAVFFSSDPCSGNVSSLRFSSLMVGNDRLDYPSLAYLPSTDTVYITWAGSVSGVGRMFVGKFSPSLGTLNFGFSSCSNAFNPTVINSAFDSHGILHLVYADGANHKIRHERYNPANSTFACLNNQVGDWFPATNTCPTQSKCGATYGGLQSSCLRISAGPSIAAGRNANDDMIVTYSTPGSGSCAALNETRIYHSAANGGTTGDSWALQMVTGCHVSIQPRAAARVWQGGSTSVFHVMSSYTANATRQLAQVDWRSTDGGLSWSGTFMTAARDQTGPAPGNEDICYWGDFNGAVYDGAHDRMFYSFTQQASPKWTIHGVTNDP